MNAGKRPGRDKIRTKHSKRSIRWLFLLIIPLVVLGLVLPPVFLGKDEQPPLPQEEPTNATPQGASSEDPSRVSSVDIESTHAAQLDLGRVPIGQWVEPTFRVRNSGQSAVTLTIPWEGVIPLVGC